MFVILKSIHFKKILEIKEKLNSFDKEHAFYLFEFDINNYIQIIEMIEDFKYMFKYSKLINNNIIFDKIISCEYINKKIREKIKLYFNL